MGAQQKKYLFKKTTGEWVYGVSTNSICPAGIYRLEIESSGHVTVRHIYNRDIADQYGSVVADFLKENGQAYATLSELIAATSGFFGSPASLTGPESPAMNAGRLGKHGEITSLAAAFSIEGKYFSICVVPKVASTDVILIAQARLWNDDNASNFPFPINDWTPGIVAEIPAGAINTTNYYIFWAY